MSSESRIQQKMNYPLNAILQPQFVIRIEELRNSFFALFSLESINCCGTSSFFVFLFFSLSLRWSFEDVSALVLDIQIKELSRF